MTGQNLKKIAKDKITNNRVFRINSMPEYLIDSRFPAVEEGGLCLSSYRIFHNEYKAEIFVSKPMITYIFSGTKEIVSGETGITVLTGEFCFVPKGNYLISSAVPSHGEAFSALLIFLSDEIIQNFIDAFGKNYHGADCDNFEKIYHCRAGSLLSASAKSLLPYLEMKSEFKKSLIACKIEEFLLNVLENDKNGSFFAFLYSGFIKNGNDLKNYMLRNYSLPLTVSEFAANTFRSLSSFKKEFKNLFHETPKRWINSKRLEMASVLLLSGNYSVTEVCFLCGFDSLSYFICLFRERFGKTPKQYQTSGKL